jgi:hypothetical protein
MELFVGVLLVAFADVAAASVVDGLFLGEVLVFSS